MRKWVANVEGLEKAVALEKSAQERAKLDATAKLEREEALRNAPPIAPPMTEGASHTSEAMGRSAQAPKPRAIAPLAPQMHQPVYYDPYNGGMWSPAPQFQPQQATPPGFGPYLVPGPMGPAPVHSNPYYEYQAGFQQQAPIYYQAQVRYPTMGSLGAVPNLPLVSLPQVGGRDAAAPSVALEGARPPSQASPGPVDSGMLYDLLTTGQAAPPAAAATAATAAEAEAAAPAAAAQGLVALAAAAAGCAFG